MYLNVIFPDDCNVLRTLGPPMNPKVQLNGKTFTNTHLEILIATCFQMPIKTIMQNVKLIRQNLLCKIEFW